MAKNVDILEQLSRALSKTRKKDKKKQRKAPTYILEVDGRVLSQRPTNKKELKEAIHAAALAKPSAVIYVYTVTGKAQINLPITLNGKELNKGEK